MKKTLSVIVLCMMTIALFSGCDTDVVSPNSQSTLKGKLTLSGSTSVQPVAAALAEAFMGINPGVSIDIQEGGSSVGISDAMAKKVDLGMSSRELQAEETGLNETVIAYDGIAVIVHKDVTVDNLTRQQLQDIYSRKIKDWKEVGGKPGAIVLIGRDAASGTRGAFEEIIKLDNKNSNPKAMYAQEKDSTGAVKATVQSTKNSIGYVSLEAVDNTVHAVRIDGVAPTVQNVKSRTYLIWRPFLFLNNKDTVLSPAAKEFIKFILSADGQKIVTDLKFISVN